MDTDALYAAAIAGDAAAISKLEMEADTLDEYERTILHIESINGNAERVRFILRELSNKNLLVKLGDQKETALAWAAYYGHTEVVELLIDAARRSPSSSSDNNNIVSSFHDFLRHVDKDSETALNIAARRGHTAVAKLLVEADPSDRHIRNAEGKSPVYVAAENGYKDIIKVMCATCTALSLDGPDGSTALHAAIKNLDDAFEVVEVLLGAARVFLNSSENDDKTLTLVTSFQAFLRQGDEDLNTGLHLAVMQGSVAIVKLLVEADPSHTHVQNLEGKTPMYIAVEEGHNDIVEIICTTCTAQSLDGPDGDTALRLKNLDQGENPGGTLYEIYDIKDALYADAISGDADAIAKLEMKADRLNRAEETILHVESKLGNTEHVRFILRQFAHKNLLVKLDNQKETALTWAAYKGHTEVAELLIDAARHLPPSANDNPVTSFQAFLRLGDKDMDTALHIAVINNHIAIVKLLVEADPSDRHKQNKEGKTPIYIAVKKGYKEIVKLICTSCTAPSLQGPGVKTALHAGTKDPDHDTEVVEVLIGAARKFSSSSEDDNTQSLVSSFQTFLRQGDKDMNTALHLAAMQGNLATIKLLVEADPSDTHLQNNKGETPIYIAAERGYYDIVKMICTTCTALSLDGPDGSTALHAAIKNLRDAFEVVEVLLGAARAFLNSSSEHDDETHTLVSPFQALLRQGDEDLNTALHLAVMKGSVAIVKLLAEADPSHTHVQNLEGKTPMYIAVEEGHDDIVEIICTTCTTQSLDGPDGNTALRIKNLDQGKNPGGTLYEIYDVKDVLYADAIAGDADAIAKLETEADRLNKDAETILHVESKKGNTEHVRFILREFAHKNLLVKLDNQKETALTWAAYFGHTEVAEVLIDAARHLPPSANDNPVTSFQAFLRLGDKDMDTALHIAVINNHIEIVKLLVEADPSDRHKQNNEGKTPVYIAVKKGYKEIVKLICTTCTAPSLEGPGVKTALRAAIKDTDHDTEVVEVLIGAATLLYPSSDDDNTHSLVSSFQAFLRQGDKDMNTALHLAVMQGNLATAKLLVEADPSDTHLQNKKGETPMYIAAERGYYDIVKMICTTCTSPSNLDGPCGTALHAAIKNLDRAKEDYIEVIRMIIKSMKWMGSGEDEDQWDDDTYERSVDLFRKTDENRCTCLELAVDGNYADIVELILAENPVYQAWNTPDFIDLMPLIYRAMDKDYKDIVNLLTHGYDRGARITFIYDDVAAFISAIKGRKRESAFRLLDDCTAELVTFVDNLGWTALHHAAYHEFDSLISPLIEAQKRVEHQYVYENAVSTPFHVAAEKGYTSTVIRLMQSWPSSSSAYTAVDKKGQNILHLAALQSKTEMIQGILHYCPEKHKDEIVNKQDNSGNTPLHILIRRGCFVPELMKYKGLDTVKKNDEKWTPSDMLYFEDKIIDDQVQIKIALDEIQTNQKEDILVSVVLPSKRETKDRSFNKQTKLMMREKHARMKEDLERYKNTHAVAHWFPDAIAGDANARAALEMEADILNEEGETILHVEAKKGDTERVGYIVREFANKNLLVKLDRLKQTSLHLAAHHGHTEVVEVLIDAATHLPSSNSAKDNPLGFLKAFVRQVNAPKRNTALHVAVNKGYVAIVKLLVEADPSGRHFPNDEGRTPIYIAAEKGYNDIIKVICTTCTALCLDGPGGSTTALHAAILNIHQAKEEDRDVIRMMIDAAKRWSSAEAEPNVSFEALFNKTDMSGHTVLELAVDRNYVDTVELILQENPAYLHGRGSKNGLMRLIYKAIDKEYTDIVKLLSETYEAGITTGHKGVVALILAINRRDEDSVIRLLGEAKHLVTFADDEGWTPLHYAAYQEFVSILDVIIKALKDVKYQFVYGDMVSTPFHLAAECKYTSTVIRLMQSWPASSSAYTAVNKNGQNILHLAATNNKKEMIQGILKYCPEKYKDKILEQQDTNGNTPLHLLISNGCFIPELIKHKGLDTMAKNKKKWTPRDMLYFQEEIIADQVQIKIALDDVQTNQSWKFWGKNMEKKMDIDQSSVRPSTRETKDVIFNEHKKLLIDAKHGRMKKDLERYKKRTNTQIIVTALITTVTFTVGFTMPGGLHQSGEVDEGLVVLTKKTAFNAFMVSDALALLLSICSLFLYFLESMYEDPHQVSKLNAASVGLNIVSIMAMMLTFITGTYLVLSHTLAIAITVCLIGSFFFIFVIVLLIKLVYDRQVKRNED